MGIFPKFFRFFFMMAPLKKVCNRDAIKIATMAEKEESEADVQFVEEGVLEMEAERTLSRKFSNININHDMFTRTKVVIYLSFSHAIKITTQLKSRCN